MTRKKITVSVIAVLAAFAVSACIILIPERKVKTAENADAAELLSKLSIKSSDNNYDNYLAENAAFSSITQEEKITFAADFRVGQVLNIKFNSDGGLFNIKIKYRVTGSGKATPEISVMLNGKQPFSEAAGISLTHSWISAEPQTDERGNCYLPVLSEADELKEITLCDPTGYHTEPLLFAAARGENNIEIKLTNGSVYIDTVTVIPCGSKKYISANGTQNGGKGETVRIQAEMPLYRSDSSITEVCDRTSPASDPVFDGVQIWNALGGSGWGASGQSVSWKADIKKSGNYTFNFRYKQNYATGRSTFRRITVDGIPVSENLEYLEFAYGSGWQIYTPKDKNGNAYTVYLAEGEHILTLEATLGTQAEIINLASSVLYELNTVYRRIVTVTGANPDKYRDYQIEKKLPDVLEALKSETEILNGISTLVYTDGKGEDSAAITKLVWQMNEFIKNPEMIPSMMSSFQSNITAFGAWLQEKTAQPLCLDYIELLPENENPDKAEASFIKRLSFGTKQFLRSFTKEYGVVGKIYSDNKALNVWMTQGRDQYQILKGQIDNDFTANSGIPANLKLVSGGLLEAISAGIAPDVYLFGSVSDPVNFASRGALTDLTRFSDYGEFSKKFSPNAIMPFTYEKGVYALPVTASFLMMFAREDILAEVGLSVPKTWDDVYAMLTILQQNNMEFGFPPPNNLNIDGFALLLFQKQRKLYNNNGKTVAINTEEALKTFEQWTRLYTDYSSVVDYNFVNRFRMGDMPIGIADFITYNTLQVSAPEINGMWNMYSVPGDGSGIGYSVINETSAFILKQTEKPEDSWEFLKWFTGDKEQSVYAEAIENAQGVSARFATANINAFNSLPWKSATLNELNRQREKAIGIEQVPGGYFLSRHIDNIYRAVKNKGEDVRQTVFEYTDVINAELTRKRREFGLEAAE